MDKTPNKDYFKRNFIYRVHRWEEWTQGRCISQGAIDLLIQAINRENTIEFIISGDTKGLRVAKVTSYDYSLSKVSEGGRALLPSVPAPDGRIRYMTIPEGLQDVQIIAELHFEDRELAYIRFAFDGRVDTEGADRILEFYGEVIELETPDGRIFNFEESLRKE